MGSEAEFMETLHEQLKREMDIRLWGDLGDLDKMRAHLGLPERKPRDPGEQRVGVTLSFACWSFAAESLKMLARTLKESGGTTNETVEALQSIAQCIRGDLEAKPSKSPKFTTAETGAGQYRLTLADQQSRAINAAGALVRKVFESDHMLVEDSFPKECGSWIVRLRCGDADLWGSKASLVVVHVDGAGLASVVFTGPARELADRADVPPGTSPPARANNRDSRGSK